MSPTDGRREALLSALAIGVVAAVWLLAAGTLPAGIPWWLWAVAPWLALGLAVLWRAPGPRALPGAILALAAAVLWLAFAHETEEFGWFVSDSADVVELPAPGFEWVPVIQSALAVIAWGLARRTGRRWWLGVALTAVLAVILSTVLGWIPVTVDIDPGRQRAGHRRW